MKSGQRRIGLYGGTFDPVHNGHLTLAQRLVEKFGLDELRFIPAYSAPHKRQKVVTPALYRYAMLVLATRNDPALRVSFMELEAPARPYTVETLATVRAAEDPATRLFFIMGADSWAEIDTWREFERVLSLTDHIVVTRPGYVSENDQVAEAIRKRTVDVQGADATVIEEQLARHPAPGIFFSDVAAIDVSATEIRQAVGGGDLNWQQQVPGEVAAFIEKYGLYK